MCIYQAAECQELQNSVDRKDEQLQEHRQRIEVNTYDTKFKTYITTAYCRLLPALAHYV